MKIYRLENHLGHGVYNAANLNWPVDEGLVEDYSGDGKNESRHPGPQKDSLFVKNCAKKHPAAFADVNFLDNVLARFAVQTVIECRYVFGFRSPAQLLRWFFNREDLVLMERERCIRVSVYECDDVIEGSTQVAFGIWHHLLFTTGCDAWPRGIL